MSNESPFISVVIPTYNRVRLLKTAIDSVLEQGFENLELIVVDDGSMDDTRSIVEGIPDDRVRLLRQRNAGPAAARNCGVKAARGRFVTFLDDDDEALPDWLSTIVSACTRDEASVVFCGALHEERDRPQLPRDLGPAFEGLVGLFGTGGVVSMERDLFLEIGGFREEALGSEHTEMGLRFARLIKERNVPVSVIQRPLIWYRRHSGARLTGNPRLLLQGASYVLDVHHSIIARDPKMHSNFCAVAAVNAFRLGEKSTARKYFAEAFFARPNIKNALRLTMAYSGITPRRFWSSA